MKKSISLLLALIIAVLTASCGDYDYRPEAIGTFGEVIVIMDSTRQASQTAEAIRSTFGRTVYTLPDPEPWMELRFRSFSSNNQLDQLKKFKNIIIAAPINGESNTAEFIRALLGDQVEQQIEAGNEFSFILRNEWYKNQWVLILTSTSDSTLARKIKNDGERLTESLLHLEMDRWQQAIYDRGEMVAIENSLWTDYGWKIRIMHDWDAHLDTSYTVNGTTRHFFTMQRITTENDRRFWAWWMNKPVDVDTLRPEWINNQRDKIMERWIRGSRDSSYVTTEYRRPVLTDTLTIDGHSAYETLGTWRMTHDAMSGPFVNMTIYDAEQERLFMLEFFQFAPSKEEKRIYVRRFRAMLRTFQSDSTWSAAQQ